MDKLRYTFIVWLLTVSLGPLLWILFEIFFYHEKASNMFELLPLSLFMGLILSLPTLLIHAISSYLLSLSQSPTILIKLILLAIGVSCIVITFQLIGGSLSNKLTVFYLISMALSSTLIKLKYKQD
ncbi:MAG: hypothetical protein ACI9J3_002461 [Parvicellaceae bacterium]|jgi:hypothetical protein